MPLNDPWLPAPSPSDGKIPTQRPPIFTRVTRRKVSSSGAVTHSTLDNLEWTEIREQVGDAPPTAQLVYKFPTGDPAAPAFMEQALSTAFTGSKVVNPGDRIVILATRPDGQEEAIFDGFAMVFGGSQDPRSEAATITCVGVGFRLRDAPIRRRFQRDSDLPGTGTRIPVDLEPHFNPKGVGNCIPDKATGVVNWEPKTADPDKQYPIFADSSVSPALDALKPTLWTYPKLARYLLFTENPQETYVKNPLGSDLDKLLVARIPIAGTKFDPAVPASYTTAPLVVPDKPLGGKDVVSALRSVIRGKGFEVAYRLRSFTTGGVRTQETSLDVFSPQLRTAWDVWLQPRGSTLDLSLTNLSGMNVGRDLTPVANEVYVIGEFREVELSVVLAPLFKMPDVVDISAEALNKYDRTHADFLKVYDDFRLFGLDEAGEGHYLPGGRTLISDAPTLDGFFGPPQGGVPRYCKHRRVPGGTLFTKDAKGRPVKARLDISTDFPGKCPGEWDSVAAEGVGTWRPVLGHWELCKDRVGIYVNAQSPNHWNIGRGQGGFPFSDGIVKIVECLQAPSPANPIFWLRLTTVLKEDRRVIGIASRKLNNVLPDVIRRDVTAYDRVKHQRINQYSVHGTPGADTVVRDDTKIAESEAQAIQAVCQNGVLSGPLEIPRFTRMYQVGDRIRGVNGRGLMLRTDSDGTDAAPTYPVITSIVWRNARDGQFTVLDTSDADAARPAIKSTGGATGGRGRGRRRGGGRS